LIDDEQAHDKVPGCYVVAFRDSPVGNIKVANAQAAVRAQAAMLEKSNSSTSMQWMDFHFVESLILPI
jgi:hypothetical protein